MTSAPTAAASSSADRATAQGSVIVVVGIVVVIGLEMLFRMFVFDSCFDVSSINNTNEIEKENKRNDERFALLQRVESLALITIVDHDKPNK
jgi:hypothetical protein